MGWSKIDITRIIFTISLVLLTRCSVCQTNNEKIDDEPYRPNTLIANESSLSMLVSIDQLLTPSDTCKEIVGKFASAISNFTHCSVTNSRPIHLCGWCIGDYLSVKKTYHDLFVTVDEKGNPCKEYFTNLDRIEIVTDAFNYVHNLWKKGSCDYCFKKSENGTVIPEVTDDVTDFILLYEMTKSCFNEHLDKNDTCTECKPDYEKLNSVYIDMVEKYKENVCLDLVDTMNTTRAIWSQLYHCTPPRQKELWLHVGMGIVGVIPVIFYLVVFLTSSKTEARVLHQRRLAEVFAVTSNSGNSEASGYLSSRAERSPTITSSRSASHSAKTSSDPPPNQNE